MNVSSSGNQFQFTLALFALSLTFVSPLARAATEDNLEKTFAVTPGGKIILDIDRGSIDVTSGNGSDVKVEVFRKVSARTKSKEQEILREHQINFQQEGNTVTVRASGKNDSFKLWNSDRTRFEFRYVISVPQKFDVDLKTSGGGISVKDLIGDVKVRTSGGGLELSKIRGPIKGQTSGGSIKIKQFKGDAVVKTSGGGITSEQIEGNLTAFTSGGSISASLAGQPSRDCRLETSGGNITVKLNQKTGLDVDASTSGGRVDSELPVAIVGQTKHSSLRGKLNGGGKSLVLHTSGGNIKLRKL
jgi:hypothetical protein